MNKFNRNNRDFFETYVKTKQEQRLKNKKLVKKPNKNLAIKLLSLIIIFLTIIALGFFACFNYFFGNFKPNSKFQKNCEQLGVKSMDKINKKFINIAIFGVDKRDGEKNGRSDAAMILTIDKEHHKIKLTSLMRDSLVKIKDDMKEKLCHAFSYGGAQLATRTINDNFDLDIFDYITVNFTQMADVVNVIGGLDVYITKQDAFDIDGLLNSTRGFKKAKRVPRLSSKKQLVHLTGEQVLQYCRMRKSDNDIKRVERQQLVLNLIFEKLRNINKTKYPQLIRTILNKIDTSLKASEILELIPFLITLKSKSIERCKIPNPEDKSVSSGTVKGLWCWIFDIKEQTKKLHQFIYEDKSKYRSKLEQHSLN